MSDNLINFLISMILSPILIAENAVSQDQNLRRRDPEEPMNDGKSEWV